MPPPLCFRVFEFSGKSKPFLLHVLREKGLEPSDMGGQIQVVAEAGLYGPSGDISHEVRIQTFSCFDGSHRFRVTANHRSRSVWIVVFLCLPDR